MSAVYYDAGHDRLVYIGRPADEDYWDDHWSEADAALVRTPDRFVLNTTRKYLPRGARVIDAGCGLARTVFGLHHDGYDAYGIDYAPKTVEMVKGLAPELRVSVADVRDLSEFPDRHFDGYWSLGVVEHFPEGYQDIVREMRRVTRGYAFVTVPSMSPLRKLKAALGGYPNASSADMDGFYQFALDPASIVQTFTEAGFNLVSIKPRGGFKGLKDELRLPGMQRLYDSRLKPLRALRAGMDAVLSPLTFHTQLYVFR